MLLAFVLLLSCTQNKDILKIGMSPDYPPFEFQEKGELKGFDVDLAHHLGKKLDKKIKIITMDFSNLVPSLQQGKIDLILSSLTKTQKRSEELSFSYPYYYPEYALLIKKNPYKIIGVQLGSTMEIFLKKENHGLTFDQLKVLNNNQILFEELKQNKIDALLLEYSQAKIFFQKDSKNLQLVKLLQRSEGYSLALRKDDPLLKIINSYLLEENSFLQQLEKKWIKNDL